MRRAHPTPRSRPDSPLANFVLATLVAALFLAVLVLIAAPAKADPRCDEL